jgi:predicted ATPase
MTNDLYVRGIRLNRPVDAAGEDNYVFSLPVVRNLYELALQSPVTFFAGENGTGKSTLLEAVAVNFGFNPEGGTRNFNFASKETH